jgi:hypothetical protein
LIFFSCTAMARSSPPIRFRMFLLRPIAQGHLTTKRGPLRLGETTQTEILSSHIICQAAA